MRKPMIEIINAFVLILFFLTAALVLAQRRGPAAAAKIPEGVTVHRDIAYVTDGHERQKLDLYVPNEGENLPLIIWVHGGAWKVGTGYQPPLLQYNFRVICIRRVYLNETL